LEINERSYFLDQADALDEQAEHQAPLLAGSGLLGMGRVVLSEKERYFNLTEDM